MSEQEMNSHKDQFNHASFMQRVGATIIDIVVLSFVALAIGFLASFFIMPDSDVVEISAQVLGNIVGWLYGPILESTSIQATIGKLAMGLKVTDEKGNRISFLRAFGRNLAKILSVLTLLIGFIMVAFTSKKQGLHDIIAKTLVLRKDSV